MEALSSVTNGSLLVAAGGEDGSDDASSAPASAPTRVDATPASRDTGLGPDGVVSLSVDGPIAGDARRQRIQLGMTAGLLAAAALGGATVALSVTRGSAAAIGAAALSASVASSMVSSAAPSPAAADVCSSGSVGRARAAADGAGGDRFGEVSARPERRAQDPAPPGQGPEVAVRLGRARLM